LALTPNLHGKLHLLAQSDRSSTEGIEIGGFVALVSVEIWTKEASLKVETASFLVLAIM